MKFKRPAVRLRASKLTAIAATALVAGSVFAAIDETHVYGVAEFGGSGDCGSPSQSHPVHEDTAAAFSTHFSFLKVLGRWDDVVTNNNGATRGSYWTDASKSGSCACTADDANDGQGVDDADVAYIHTHGGHASGSYSHLSMGNSAYDCSVRTTDNMLFDSDLDFAIVKACQSGDRGEWAGGGYRSAFTDSSSPFRLWNAFHGNSSCGSHVTSYVTSYVWSSDSNGVGENWIDAAYDDDSSANTDDCPTSIAIGASKSERSSLFEYGGWRDRKDTGAKTGSTIFFISGCDPAGGDVLP